MARSTDDFHERSEMLNSLIHRSFVSRRSCPQMGMAADGVSVGQKPSDQSQLHAYRLQQGAAGPQPARQTARRQHHARGWLRHQLELEADGMAGHLEEISPWCKFEGNAWTDPRARAATAGRKSPTGSRATAISVTSWRTSGSSTTPSGGSTPSSPPRRKTAGSGPPGLRTSLKGKPDLWPHMPVLNALQSYYEFSGDERVIKLMTRYFKWELDCPDADFITGYWDKMRTGDNLESVYWLYNRTGDKWLLDLADKLHKHAADWVSNGAAQLAQRQRRRGVPRAGRVLDAGPRPQAPTPPPYHDYDTVMGLYGQVPGGGFGGDENCRPGYHDPRQGFETCGIVEFMHSFEMLSRITGDPVWADRMRGDRLQQPARRPDPRPQGAALPDRPQPGPAGQEQQGPRHQQRRHDVLLQPRRRVPLLPAQPRHGLALLRRGTVAGDRRRRPVRLALQRLRRDRQGRRRRGGEDRRDDRLPVRRHGRVEAFHRQAGPVPAVPAGAATGARSRSCAVNGKDGGRRGEAAELHRLQPHLGRGRHRHAQAADAPVACGPGSRTATPSRWTTAR